MLAVQRLFVSLTEHCHLNRKVMSRPIVIIDDTDPRIQYSGPWFEVDNTQITTGTFGPPFQNTLHGVTVNANFSFPFTGMSRLLLLIFKVQVAFEPFLNHSIVVFRMGNPSLRDTHNNKCFWDPSSNLGVFC
jgi:hypothetical protein